jgi:protein ImuB
MNAPSRRYLSVWLKRLSTDRLERRSAAPAETPLIVVEQVKSARRICALNDAAMALNLKMWMPLADACAMYPSLWVENADPQNDSALLETIADWCDRYTPLVGLDPPDGLIFDISGCAHLFGGEQALRDDLLERLSRQGLRAEVGIADTVGCAWAAARYGEVTLVPKGATRDSLRALPLAALRLGHVAIAALAQAGLKRIADVIDRPRAPLAARFGDEFLRRLDQALGRDNEPIRPRLPLPSYVAERRFPDPIVREEDVLGTIGQLACELGRLLERHGEGARLLQVALFRVDGKVHRLEAGTGRPLRDPDHIKRLFAERLVTVGEECDPGFGYDTLRLSALVCERLDPVQAGLAGQDDQIELAHLVDRLSARFGAQRLTRLVARDSHIPEYAAAAIPAQMTSRGTSGAAPFEQGSHFQDSLASLRPLRLFNRPESIEAIAEVPDGPPARFRWRHMTYEVAAAEGPERIAMEWWRDAEGRPLTRDYFRVESRQGMRVWLYREGLYDRDKGVPRWFLHGLFA